MVEREAERRRKAEFLASVPKRLAAAHTLALSLGVSSSVKLLESGPEVSFRNDSDPYIDGELTYTCEEWELEHVESQLNQIRIDKEAREYRLKIAKEAFETLTTEQRNAIKEFISYLR